MKKEGLSIILEQNLEKIKEYLKKQVENPEVQDVFSKVGVSITESQKCITCSDRIEDNKFYTLKNEDGTESSDGLPFADIYMKKGGNFINLEDELKKIIEKDILFDVDTTKEPLNSLSDKEKDNYKPLTGKEAETLEYICYVKATLLNYAKNENSLKPKTALKYWKQICDKFKPKYEKDESEDESVINTTPTVGKIYGCFDSTSESYWCDQPGNECPEGLDDSDFTGISTRVDIGGVTYIHTGCTYEETIVLENTYVFAGPGKTFDFGTHTIKAPRKNTLKRIREKIENSPITGSYPPITNAPGFYNNEFFERVDNLRSDLNNALVLMLSRHCMKGTSIPRELTIYEGDSKSKPLGQFDITQKNGTNCISNFGGLQAWESGEILQIRLKQLMFDELDEESGTEHKVPENIIVKFNSYINGKLSEDGKEDDIIIDRNGNLKLESELGLSKVLENKPIGLEKILK